MEPARTCLLEPLLSIVAAGTWLYPTPYPTIDPHQATDFNDKCCRISGIYATFYRKI